MPDKDKIARRGHAKAAGAALERGPIRRVRPIGRALADKISIGPSDRSGTRRHRQKENRPRAWESAWHQFHQLPFEVAADRFPGELNRECDAATLTPPAARAEERNCDC